MNLKEKLASILIKIGYECNAKKVDFQKITMDFASGVATGSKVMVVWGELQEGGEALQVNPALKINSRFYLFNAHSHAGCHKFSNDRRLWRIFKSKWAVSQGDHT